MYYVAVTFKMTEWVEPQMCIKFCVKFEQSSIETIEKIQKTAGMGNWWLTASSQHTGSRITSRGEFFGEISNHPGDSDPLQPRFGALRLLSFPKTKITFERKEISDSQWDSGKYDTELIAIGRTVKRSQVTYFEGHWGVIVQCTMFLMSCIFFNKCLYFHITWLDTF